MKRHTGPLQRHPPRAMLWRARRQIAGYAVGPGLSSGLTAVIVLVTAHTAIPNISLLYIPAILVTAVYFGTGPALLASTVAVGEYDFFLLEPRYTLSIARAQDVIAFVIFVAVALLTSQLAVRARTRAETAARQARESEALYQLGQALMAEQALPRVLGAIAQHIVEALGIRDCAIFTSDTAGLLLPAATAPHEREVSRESRSAAAWVYHTGEELVLQEQTSRPWHRLLVPLRTADRVVGVMEVGAKRSGDALDADDRRLVTSLAAQTALVVVRARGDEERQRRQVLEESDRLKSALLSAVSHDLRTPLASIKAAATALLSPEGRLPAEGNRELMQAINQEADRLNRLVGNLLDLSRIEAGVLRPALDWYDIHDVLDSALPRIRPLLGARPLEVQVASDLPAIQIDLLRVEELLFNLFDNAAKYTPAERPLGLTITHSENGIAIAVVDHGIGVPGEQRERIFHSFQRGRAHSDRHPGTGLGLAICRGIAEAHGGSIAVRETPGGGATFVFTLPPSHIANQVAV